MAANEKLKDLITQRFGSYEKLGEEIGITAQGVGEIVAGRSRGATGRYAVARAVGSTVAELWPETDPAEEEQALAS